MIVVSDTSPVSNLILIGKLNLLNDSFDRIVVPTFVDSEVKALSHLGHDIDEYESSDWIDVRSPKDESKVISLLPKLDRGEAEAITIALETNCDLLLMDERIGIRVARSEGLQTIGLIGVLVRAKRLGFVNEVGPILRELRLEAGFWISAELELRVLTETGEI